jgi:hypothetical protein
MIMETWYEKSFNAAAGTLRQLLQSGSKILHAGSFSL